ncbi:uncharacterized protein Tco_0243518, partial [Tanacetum coccineum]
HRRWLKENNKLRRDKAAFNGEPEWDPRPRVLSGSELLDQLKDVETVYKKEDVFKKRKREELDKENERERKAALRSEKRKMKEKMKGKGKMNVKKDHLNARLDLKELNIRPSLHPQETNSSRILLPPACFTLGKDEKYQFLKLLKDLKVPDGYASNISRCVHLKELSMWGLKSHDNHIFLQQLLPLAVRRLLSNFFRILCSKVNSKYDLQKLQDRISLTLCHLEKIFPPYFFDIMEHLPIHLAEEALLAGPVQYRWMYPIERYLLTLKMYLKDIETKSTRPDQNYSGEDNLGSHFGMETPFFLDHLSMEQAHRYLLASNDAVAPYRERHLRADVLKQVAEKKVLTTEVIDMAMGLTNMAKRYNGYVVNGFRFRTKGMDNSRVTQNSGVVVIASTTSFSSRKDKSDVRGVNILREADRYH